MSLILICSHVSNFPCFQVESVAVGSVLPEPWVSHHDAGSGQTYYYNSVTGESSWTRPVPVPSSPTAPMPVPKAPAQIRSAAVNGPGWNLFGLLFMCVGIIHLCIVWKLFPALFYCSGRCCDKLHGMKILALLCNTRFQLIFLLLHSTLFSLLSRSRPWCIH